MRFNLVITTLILFSIFACKKNNSEFYDPGQWNMNKVEGISTGTLNQTISLTVFYSTSSGCDIFDRFEQSIQGKIVSIKAYGHTETSTYCVQAALERSATFDFKPTTTGLYELRFFNRDNSYFTHNLTINK
jgi:hypothetical protein